MYSILNKNNLSNNLLELSPGETYNYIIGSCLFYIFIWFE